MEILFLVFANVLFLYGHIRLLRPYRGGVRFRKKIMVNFRRNSHPGAVDAHPGAMEAHYGAMETPSGAVEDHPGAMKVHHGGVEAGLVMMKAHYSSRCAYRLQSQLHCC